MRTLRQLLTFSFIAAALGIALASCDSSPSPPTLTVIAPSTPLGTATLLLQLSGHLTNATQAEVLFFDPNFARPSFTPPPGPLGDAIALSSPCPCAITVPYAPVGTVDALVFAFDDKGNAIGANTLTATVSGTKANSASVTLEGVPFAVSVAPLPSAAAGTPIAPRKLGVEVYDADGVAITGPFISPVSFSTTDMSGATQIASSPDPMGMRSGTDTVTFSYSGLSIAPIQITPSGGNVLGNPITFAPVLSPIVLSTSEIDLYSSSGAGSSATLTATETGWTGSYGRSLAMQSTGCSQFATVLATGSTYTVTAVPYPQAGTCTVTFQDGAGQQANLTLTYTDFTVGIQKERSK